MDSIPKGPGVYLITNVLDGKVYVGSSVNMQKRCREHVSQLGRGRHHNRRLQSAWRKHGPEAFTFTVLEVVKRSDREATIPVEQKWLDFFQAGRNDCYNFLELASSPGSRQLSLEARRKLSAALIGRKLTPEHKAKLRAAKLGRKLSPAHCAALGAARLGKKLVPRTDAQSWLHRKMTVEQVQRIRDLHGAGWGAPSIAAEVGVGKSTIRRVLDGESYAGVGAVKAPDPERVAARLRTKQRLTPEQVREIRGRHRQGETIASLARTFGIGHSSATRIVRGASYAWVTG